MHGDEDPPGDLYPERRSPWGLIGDSDFDGDIRVGKSSWKEGYSNVFFFFFNEGDGYISRLRCEFLRLNLGD